MLKYIKFLIIPVSLMFSCSDPSTPAGTNSGNNGSGGGSGSGGNTTDWLIPKSEVLDGGPGKDGIPALENPESVDINQIDFLADNDLVIGFEFDGQARAYPHKILDWHEIINDDVNGKPVAITYCPLTGTSIAWSRELKGQTTTFGVSGLLYNTNLIPYDRLTDSNWSQMRLECVNGELSGEVIETYHLIETSWKTWKEMYPNSSVVSTNTGFSRNYTFYPYGDYRSNNSKLLFPVTPTDDRLPEKERVLGLVLNNKAKVYRLNSFKNGTRVIMDLFEDLNVVIVGNKDKNFIVAFENEINDEIRTFTAIDEGANVMQDDKGNKYNLFGIVTEGTDVGNQLKSTTSFMGFWFGFGAFYSNSQIFGGA